MSATCATLRNTYRNRGVAGGATGVSPLGGRDTPVLRPANRNTWRLSPVVLPLGWKGDMAGITRTAGPEHFLGAQPATLGGSAVEPFTTQRLRS